MHNSKIGEGATATGHSTCNSKLGDRDHLTRNKKIWRGRAANNSEMGEDSTRSSKRREGATAAGDNNHNSKLWEGAVTARATANSERAWSHHAKQHYFEWGADAARSTINLRRRGHSAL